MRAAKAPTAEIDKMRRIITNYGSGFVTEIVGPLLVTPPIVIVTGYSPGLRFAGSFTLACVNPIWPGVIPTKSGTIGTSPTLSVTGIVGFDNGVPDAIPPEATALSSGP